MAPAYSWFLAVRYLLARWVNVLGMVGIAVAVWALIVVIAVFSGFISEIRAHIRGATADLVLSGVKRNCSFAEVDEVLRADPDVLATAPRLTHYGILFPYDRWGLKPVYTGALGNVPLQRNLVTLIGVDPERERQTTGFADWLSGVPRERTQAEDERAMYRVPDLERPFEVSEALHKRGLHRAGREVPAGPMLQTGPGLIVGYRRLTRGQDRMLPGQLLDLVSARFVREPGQPERVQKIKMPFVINGAFATQYRAFDDAHAFVHIDLLREMLGQDPDSFASVDLVDSVAIRLRDGADLLAVQSRLSDIVHEVSGGRVLTWEEQNAVFLGAVDHERGMMKIVLFAVMVVAGFLIYATLHMMVMQKVKDIGILSSLGATQRGIAAIFTICGVVVAVVGCSAGAISGILSAYYLNDVNDWLDANFGWKLFPPGLYDLEAIPYRIEATWVLQVLGAAFVLALLVAWFPARRAARMNPVEALSYE